MNKQLTFEQIAPLWASVIAKKGVLNALSLEGHRVQGHDLNIVRGACCIVGEAHKFHREYQDPSSKGYCRACDGFCYALLNISAFPKRKAEFVKHWNEAHVK